MQLEVGLAGRKKITIICAEQKQPFAPYRKYGLAGLQQIRIGWNPGNDIQYQDQPSKERYVSGEHCLITLKNGNWELQDKSKNGTYVNFQRAYGNVILRYGDSIRIMRLHMIFLGNMLAINDCDGLRVVIPPVEGGERINSLASPGSGNAAGKILFHRSPRNLKKLHTDPIEIEAPPQPEETKEQPLAMQIGPSLTMAIPMILGSSLSFASLTFMDPASSFPAATERIAPVRLLFSFQEHTWRFCFRPAPAFPAG
jgi:S-DNA-T family DNA segregation ATPase FtsK/SpoIIIE